MKNTMKLLAVALIAGGTMFAAPRVAIGINVGRTPCPGPGYTWVDGFYNPYGVWTAGFWRAPVGPRYVAPHYVIPRRVDVHRDFNRRGHDFGHDRHGFRGRR